MNILCVCVCGGGGGCARARTQTHHVLFNEIVILNKTVPLI